MIRTTRVFLFLFAMLASDADAQEQNIADQNIADQNIADQNVADQNVADQNVADQNVVDQNIVDQNIADQRRSDGSPSAAAVCEVDESRISEHPVTPFMESSSVMLAEVDLNKIDLAAMLIWMQGALGFNPLPPAASDAASGLLDSLKSAGANRLYLCGSTRSFFDGGPVLVIPCENTAVVNGLAALAVQNAPPDFPLKSSVVDGFVLVGPMVAVDRLLRRKGQNRVELIAPLLADEHLDHTLVIALPEEGRQDLGSLWPDQFPPELPLSFSPRQMVQDLKRFTVSLRLPPAPRMHAALECSDPAAAKRVSLVLRQLVAFSTPLQTEMKISVDRATIRCQVDPLTLVKVVNQVTKGMRENAGQLSKMHQLKMLGLAIHNYHNDEKSLPQQCLKDQQGNALLSWRVSLLPYLEQSSLSRKFKMDQAFDSDANQALSEMVIPVFSSKIAEPQQTAFRAPVFPGSVWHGDGTPKEFRDVTDGMSDTIALIEAPATDLVAWANPEPWVIDQRDPLSDVFGDRNLITVLLLDGSVHAFTRDELADGKLEAMLTIAGGEVIER
ncbi:MAG: DUF1559 domain-containing protein [Rubripirellula sp.]|nr:DUF1559 domain-containing protein [Rubripirellula sp.]